MFPRLAARHWTRELLLFQLFIAMSLAERINEDMKAAMRAKDSARLDAIRMLRAAIKQNNHIL